MIDPTLGNKDSIKVSTQQQQSSKKKRQCNNFVMLILCGHTIIQTLKALPGKIWNLPASARNKWRAWRSKPETDLQIKSMTHKVRDNLNDKKTQAQPDKTGDVETPHEIIQEEKMGALTKNLLEETTPETFFAFLETNAKQKLGEHQTTPKTIFYASLSKSITAAQRQGGEDADVMKQDPTARNCIESFNEKWDPQKNLNKTEIAAIKDRVKEAFQEKFTQPKQFGVTTGDKDDTSWR